MLVHLLLQHENHQSQRRLPLDILLGDKYHNPLQWKRARKCMHSPNLIADTCTEAYEPEPHRPLGWI